LSHLYIKTNILPDRLGTNIGKTPKKVPFSLSPTGGTLLTQTAAATQAVTVPPPCSPSQPRHAASEAHWKEEQGVCRWQIRTRRARKGVVISWRRRSSVLRCSASSRRCSVRGQRNRRRRERGLRSCSCSSPGLHCVAELHCTAISVHKRSYTNGSNGTWAASHHRMDAYYSRILSPATTGPPHLTTSNWTQPARP
jgi:hypothetical protein